MTDLRVDAALLEETEHSMRVIHHEFSTCTRRRDALTEIWGADAVKGAMGAFFDNWDRHRAGLLESIAAIADMAAGCREGFATVDRRLAGELREAMGSSGSTGSGR